MNHYLAAYVDRFNHSNSPKLDYFFTQLSKADIYKLPLIYGVDSFCFRLWQAMQNQEKICIYSDYDTDAVTATAVMYWGLLALGFSADRIDCYAPDRFTEGYGMNMDAARKLGDMYDLIITVDCGINSRAEAKIIQDLHADLLITDHHHLDGSLPQAKAVVNPRLNTLYLSDISDNFLGIDLAQQKLLPDVVTGVGVAWFSLVWFGYYLIYEKKVHFDLKRLNTLLPYVAIGTIADCQSILDPINRLLVKAGLSLLQSQKFTHPGLESLTMQLGLRDKINQGYRLTSQDLGFLYSPVLNSSGRISHAKLSINTLISKTQEKAVSLAQALIKTNIDRKNLVKKIIDEVETDAIRQSNNRFIWLQGSWSKGVVGLLASRLVNMYSKPVIVISEDATKGMASASLRAPEGYHLPNIMSNFKDLFDGYGGHPGAAGFSTTLDRLDAIKKLFYEYVNRHTSSQQVWYVDNAKLPEMYAEQMNHRSRILINQEDITPMLKQQVLNLDPYGQDFPFPEFLFLLCQVDKVLFMGKEKNHAKIITSQGSVTLFSIDSEIKQYLEGDLVGDVTLSQLWLAAKVSQNTWRGNTALEMIVQESWLVP